MIGMKNSMSWATGTVLCEKPAGNVAPGQTQNPTIPKSTGKLEPKNGRLAVPVLTSATQSEMETALMRKTNCPNGKDRSRSWAIPIR